MEQIVKRMSVVIALLSTAILSVASFAATPQGESNQPIPPFPKTLINAKYVYITSYDGPQFNLNILPEDREAISDVQQALQQWGHYIIVYNPRQADMIIAVQSRGSEDVLAVYDPAIRGSFLWRVMGHEGLQKGETPLVTDLQKAVERASKQTP
jgi:hypothetical protein